MSDWKYFMDSIDGPERILAAEAGGRSWRVLDFGGGMGFAWPDPKADQLSQSVISGPVLAALVMPLPHEVELRDLQSELVATFEARFGGRPYDAARLSQYLGYILDNRGSIRVRIGWMETGPAVDQTGRLNDGHMLIIGGDDDWRLVFMCLRMSPPPFDFDAWIHNGAEGGAKE